MDPVLKKGSSLDIEVAAVTQTGHSVSTRADESQNPPLDPVPCGVSGYMSRVTAHHPRHS